MKKYICTFLTFIILMTMCSCAAQEKNEGDGTSKTEKTESQSFSVTDSSDKKDELTHTDNDESFNKDDATEAEASSLAVTKSTQTQSDANEGKTTIKPTKFEIPDESDPSVRKITDDTPDNAGVNMRSKPNSSSDLIMTIPEGTGIRILDETAVGGYYKIEVRADGKAYEGYVMERYVSTFSGASFDSIVSSTPNRAGAPLYKERSGSSRVIMSVPEGTQVRVWDQDDSEEYYSVDVSIDGAVYSGFMLSKYIKHVG